MHSLAGPCDSPFDEQVRKRGQPPDEVRQELDEDEIVALGAPSPEGRCLAYHVRPGVQRPRVNGFAFSEHRRFWNPQKAQEPAAPVRVVVDRIQRQRRSPEEIHLPAAPPDRPPAEVRVVESGCGTKRTSANVRPMPAFGGEADIPPQGHDFRF